MRIAEEKYPCVIRRKGIRTEENDVELSELQEFLWVFGWSVLSVTCHHLSGHLSNLVLRMINYHCENVSDLKLTSVYDITKETMFYIRSLLSQLKHLFMETREVPVHDVVYHCTQLETLQINCMYLKELTLPATKFPNSNWWIIFHFQLNTFY